MRVNLDKYMEQGEVADNIVCLGYDLPGDKEFRSFISYRFLAHYYIDDNCLEEEVKDFLEPYSYVGKNNETLCNELEVRKKITSKVEINSYLAKLALVVVDTKAYYGLLTRKVLENYLNYALDAIKFDDIYLAFIHEESRKFESLFALFHKGKPDKEATWVFSKDDEYLYLYRRWYKGLRYCGKAKLNDHNGCFKLYLRTYLDFETDNRKGEVYGCEFAELTRTGFL